MNLSLKIAFVCTVVYTEGKKSDIIFFVWSKANSIPVLELLLVIVNNCNRYYLANRNGFFFVA